MSRSAERWKIAAAVLHALLCFWLFFIRPYGLSDILSPAVLTLAVLSDYALLHPRRPECLRLFLKPSCLIMTGVAALYAGFACFAHDVFGLEEKILLLSVHRLLCMAAIGAALMPLMLSGLYLLRCLCVPAERGKAVCGGHPARVWLLFLVSFSLVQLLLSILFYPGGYCVDTYSELMQADGGGLNDWHPYLNALLLRVLLKIWPNLWFITLVQALGMALLLASFAWELWDMGMNQWALLAGGILLQLLPGQAMNTMTVQKDTPFLYALCGALLLMFQLIRRPQRLCRPMWSCWMILALFGIFGLRHNGIVPAAGMILLLLILGIRELMKKKDEPAGRMLLAVSLLSLLLLVLWKGPVMKALQVTKNDQSPYVTMLDALGACASQNLPLSEETQAMMAEIQPMEDWAAYYGRYVGHDLYQWGQGKTSSFDTSSVTAGKAFAMYLEALRKYPWVVIKDRLDGSSILWEVLQPASAFNTRHQWFVFEGMPQVWQEWPFHTDLPAKLAAAVTPWYIEHMVNRTSWGLTDALVWRSGLYLILLALLLVYWIAAGNKKMLLVSAPLLLHVAACVLIVYHQSFRYVWAVQVMTLMLLALTIAGERDLLNKPE